MNFRQCIYSYFEIVLAADGNVYKCSSMGTPTFQRLKLGKIPNSLEKFKKMIMANHDPHFNPQICFKQGGHCARAALEINKEWQKRDN